MSSSDPGAGARRFFAGVLAGLAAAAALLAAAMVTVDPLGATDGNRLCPAGAKVVDARETRTLIAERLRPRTIVLGTSRVRAGFGRSALVQLGPGPVANLGTDAALPADFASLAADSLAGGRLERAFIGVDFNALHQADLAGSQPPVADARLPAIERWRRAFLSFSALTALPQALAGCRPVLDPGGVTIGAADRSPATDGGERARVAWQLRNGVWDRARFATRAQTLRATIASLRRQQVEVVLFSAPYQEDLVALFGELGRDREFERFHAEIARLAREEGVRFVDLHSAAAIGGLGLPPCRGGGIACHYFDLTHYTPRVGDRVARALAAEVAAGPAATPRL